MKKILIVLLLSLLPFSLMAAEKDFSQQEMDQMMAPIALYPDSLLSQILIASTYPAQVEEAVRWSKHNTALEGQEAVEAVADKNWDPSVSSLVAFPQVLDMMGKKTYWVQQLGDAFLAQPDQIMDSVQRLRIKAKDAGNLKSSKEQKVEVVDSEGAEAVVIESRSPQTVYVPVYNPVYVYGPWMYPAYLPFYYYPSYFYMAPGIHFGFSMGIFVGDIMWGVFNWHLRDVYINVPRYNSVYVHRRIYTKNRTVSWKNYIRFDNPRVLRHSKIQQRQHAQRLMDRRFINYDNFERHETMKRSGTSYQYRTKEQESNRRIVNKDSGRLVNKERMSNRERMTNKDSGRTVNQERVSDRERVSNKSSERTVNQERVSSKERKSNKDDGRKGDRGR